MALTQISTAGVKDDAVTAGKIPANAVGSSEIAANAVGSSELADNAVDTAAIADDAVTAAKIANNTITATQLNTDAVDTDALQVNSVTTAKIADQAVTLAKLPHGTGSNDGKFLRANNGADPTFETVSTDLVGDTSPQLGGNLDTNGNNINFAANDGAVFASDLTISHTGDHGNIVNTDGNLNIKSQGRISFLPANNNDGVNIINGGAVELYYNNYKKFETTDVGVRISHTGDANLQLVADSDNNGSNNWPHVQFRVDNTSGQAEAQVAYRQDNAVLKVDIAGTEKVGVNANGLVFNGDTAAANALDDYEEGTFTAGCANGVTLHSGADLLSYTKIGRQVTVRGQVLIDGSNGGSDFIINNLPFANVSTTSEDDNLSVGAVRLWDYNVPADTLNVICEVSSNNSNLNFWRNRDNSSADRLNSALNGYLAFTITYFTS